MVQVVRVPVRMLMALLLWGVVGTAAAQTPNAPAEEPSTLESATQPSAAVAPPETPAEEPLNNQDTAPPPLGAQDPFLSSLGPGTGPGLPWQVVWMVQLAAYVAADALPYLGCVAGSWVLSLFVALFAGAGLPLAVLLSVVLVPLAAVLSGLGSASLLQWIGDRLGILRGRLAVVALTSMVLSLLTYALVIFPIIVGMGFFSVAAYSFLGSSALLVVLPRLNIPTPFWASAAGYSVSAAGLVGAVAFVLAGALLAPVVGFVARPLLVALAYRVTGRARAPGEEQWPPSLFGERADLIPWPFRKRTAAQAPALSPPATTPPVAPAEPAPDATVGP